MTISLQALGDKRDQLVASLARVDDLRPGFLTARFRKCGKPNCHCAQKDSPGHGPSFSLTHRVAGKTVTQVVQEIGVKRWKTWIWKERQKLWEKKSLKTNVIARNLAMFLPCHGPCIAAWMEPASPYMRRNSWAVPANNRTDQRRLAR